MNILLIDPAGDCLEPLKKALREWTDARIVAPSDLTPGASDSVQADVIVASGHPSSEARVTDSLLAWRTHLHTCLVPCWIARDASAFERGCLWPRLTIDKYQKNIASSSFGEWLSAVASWQHDRTLIRKTSSLTSHTPLELLSSLALRKATGTLNLFSKDGTEGSLTFRDGHLIDGKLGNLSAAEVGFEFMAWSHGSYHWSPTTDGPSGEGLLSLPSLIQEGLRLLHEANLLYRLAPDLRQAVVRTESEAALDDGGVPFYSCLKQLYNLIRGEVSLAELLDASPLARPRSMIALAKWLSLEDIRLTESKPKRRVKPRRVLIVDDSQLMRRALHSIFSADPRFEVSGSAENGVEALRLLEQLKPDVVTLDLQMPVMDGLTALKHIMVRHSIPVVVLSAFAGQSSPLTYESFKYGAVDVLVKPIAKGNGGGMTEQAQEIRERVLQACQVRLEAARVVRPHRRRDVISDEPAPAVCNPGGERRKSHRLVVVLCGVGGFPLLLRLSASLARAVYSPPILVCVAFSSQVVEALLPTFQADSERPIELLQPGISLKSGSIYLSPQETCCEVASDGAAILVRENSSRLADARPFDACLGSAAEALGSGLTAVILSGLGDDGVEGMQRARREGGAAYAVSPDVCLNPDLPARVLELGLATGVPSVAELLTLIEGLHHEEPSGRSMGVAEVKIGTDGRCPFVDCSH